MKINTNYPIFSFTISQFKVRYVVCSKSNRKNDLFSDPLADKYPSMSAYMYCAGNPVMLVDPDGMRFIDINENGAYIGTSKDNWFHNLIHGTKGRIIGKDGAVVSTFKFADAVNDVQDIKDGKIKNIVNVTENQIKTMLSRAGAFTKEANNNPAGYFLNNSSGLLDFASSHIPDMFVEATKDDPFVDRKVLFIVDGVAHNQLNFGNFLWAGAGATAGIHLGALKVAAHSYSLGLVGNGRYAYDGAQLDSKDDQYSIKQGYHYARGGGLINRWFGNSRSWDKSPKTDIKASVIPGELKVGGILNE